MAARTAERAEFLCDIITAAVEGGIGYWSATRGYRFSDAGTDTVAEIAELDDDGRVMGAWHRLDADVIARGIGEIVAGHCNYVSAELRQHIGRASRSNDAGELDANDADVIVQVALFGEVVYG